MTKNPFRSLKRSLDRRKMERARTITIDNRNRRILIGNAEIPGYMIGINPEVTYALGRPTILLLSSTRSTRTS